MKTKCPVHKLLTVWFYTLAIATSVAQTTHIWTGSNGTGREIGAGTNWNDGIPPLPGDTAEWDGVVPGPLNLVYNTSVLTSGPGFSGINFYLTGNQTSPVSIDTDLPVSPNLAIADITIESGAGRLVLGGTNSSHRLQIVARPAGAVHHWINDSTNAVIINPQVSWVAGGGAVWTMDFSGTGTWDCENYLNGEVSPRIVVDGPGTMIWNPTGYLGIVGPATPIIISGGTMILKSNHPRINTQAWIINGNFIFDATNPPTSQQTLSGAISGNGLVQVNNGTLALSGASMFSGNFNLNGGELIVSGFETGTNGPLGVGGTIYFNGGTLGFSFNNTFDYSSRFSAAAGQVYSIDTGGQDVTFAAALGSSGGTLTKTNAGTLTLTGTSSYSGLTTINGSKLLFQGPKTGSGDITVADSAVLGIVENGTQITPGTLTLGSSSSAILEFNNVTNISNASLVAGAISSAGPVTITINSGTFAVGQIYPLFSWNTGPAPAVSLGTVNGALGFLSTNGNTIQINITAITLFWTGAINGNWSNPANWSAPYSGSEPTLFDDTALGTTSVIVDIPVHPSSVTVNNSLKSYSITSAGGNNIEGTTGLTKTGSGTLNLSGGDNTYTGKTIISGGTLSVGALANGGSASDIGQSSSAAASLVLDGGTLRYTGAGASIDRSFTITLGGGTIDGSDSGPLNLTTAALGYSGYGPRSLTLMGSGDNTLAAVIADSGGSTVLTKNGIGIWVLTGNNTYSGPTIINAGVLQIGNGGSSGSIGTGSITNNARLEINRTNSLTISGTISGTGSVSNSGTGTVILTGNCNYSGNTGIGVGSTLQVGNGGSGSLNLATPIIDNGLLTVNVFGIFTMRGFGASVSGTGNVYVESGTFQSLGGNTYTGWTLINPGATFQPCTGNESTFQSLAPCTNNGTVLLIRQDFDPAVFGMSNNIVGFGKVVSENSGTANAGWVRLSGTNTYTGGTWIRGGSIVLGDGINPGAGSIVGPVIFTNTVSGQLGPRSLIFNRADPSVFTNNISSAVTDGSTAGNRGALRQMGPGKVTLTGSNSYPGATIVDLGATLQIGNGGTDGSIGTGVITTDGTLIFNGSGNVTWSNVITGIGSFMKLGAGTLRLTAANTYTGTTTISNGTLIINGDNAAGATYVYDGTLGGTGVLAGPVTLNSAATLAPGASLGTLTINNDLNIGGNVFVEVNKALSLSNDFVIATGVLTNAGAGTLAVANLGPALSVGDQFTLFSKPLQNGAAITVTGSGAVWKNDLAVDGSISVLGFVSAPTLNFTNLGSVIQFSWAGDFKLQSQTNSIATGLGTNWTDYPGGSVSPANISIGPASGAVFFRLVSTP